MNLHEDSKIFEPMMEAAALHHGIRGIAIVEKDYFVTLFLQKISERQPSMVFKGGTSLSKCHKVVNRFSEDIDLSPDAKFTKSQRKGLTRDINSIIEETGFVLANPDQINSGLDFNRYAIDYVSVFPTPFLNPSLIVETSLFIKSFPSQTMEVASLVYDFLLAQNALETIEKYGLQPFKMKVQTLERTFVDKAFAIGDYYLKGQTKSRSRHVYDLYKIYPKITFDDTFRQLVSQVREARKPFRSCLSTHDGVDFPELIQKILDEGFFETDYDEDTTYMLSGLVSYSTAKTVLKRILDDGCFA